MTIRFDPLSLVEYMEPKPIKVFDPNPVYPIQLELFKSMFHNPEQIDYGLRKRIGDFYEILTQSIFGGKWVGTMNASKIENGLFQPDVITYDKIIESKAVCWKETLKLTDYQIDKYLVNQCNSFQKPDKIFFAIYKYKLRNPLIYLKQFKTNVLEEIVKTLSQETAFMMFLPFSVVYNLHNPELLNKFKSRYEDKKWDILSRFNSNGIKRMLQLPEEVLDSYNLNPEDYLIVKTRLPEGIRMNQSPIKPFPILFIGDKNHKRWLKEFKKTTHNKVQTIIEEDKRKKDYGMREEGCSDIDLDEKIPQVSQEEFDTLPF